MVTAGPSKEIGRLMLKRPEPLDSLVGKGFYRQNLPGGPKRA